MNDQAITYIVGVIAIISLSVSIYGIILARKAKRWRNLLEDEDQQPQNLEDIISVMTTKLKSLEQKEEVLRNELANLTTVVSQTVQKVGLVRFNSQADDGGNLSFSLAVLDDHQTGVVITSLHGRQQNRIYAKRIIEGKSEATLSEEETNAIIQAVHS